MARSPRAPDWVWRIGRRTAGMASAGRPELNHAGPRTGCDIDNVRPAAIHP